MKRLILHPENGAVIQAALVLEDNVFCLAGIVRVENAKKVPTKTGGTPETYNEN